MTGRKPVTDWATDFDHLDVAWGQGAVSIWADLRERCPVAHTDRFHGAYLPTRYDDIASIAYDTENFSSRTVIVNEIPPAEIRGIAPPITSDPPEHTIARRILLPAFAPRKIEAWIPATRQICRELLDRIGDADSCDAAVDYAQHVPVKVIAKMLGVPEADGDQFRHWIHQLLEEGPGDPQIAANAGKALRDYLSDHVARRREEPADDLLGFLLELRFAGEPLSDRHLVGTATLLLIAGIDTTWSSIGAALWHLANHDDDRRRLAAEPGLMTQAIEEFLRAYAPVTMARYVVNDTEIGGVTMKAGQRVLLPFPAGNRDQRAFDRADEVIIDRAENRHYAFGLGIHRCLGSNLARMEMQVALEEWMHRHPDFHVADADADAVRWSVGQIRGPRTLPLTLGVRP